MGVYDAARAYALAFSYRDVPAEVDALLGWGASVLGHPVESVIELAAGPADHARECAARGLRATALDISHAMTEYASEQAALRDIPLHAVTADMCDFAIDERFDLALTMIDSISHILDEASLDAHFRSVAEHLNDSGCYIFEASHPADGLRDQTMTKTEWTQAGDGEVVSFRWGEPGDVTDAQSGVTSVTVTVDYRRKGHVPVVVRDVVRERAWSRADFVASLERVGAFEPRAWFGSFDGVAVDDPAAWRLIAVLTRR